TQRFEFPDQRFSVDSRAGSDTLSGLPRLWATRKIGYLLSYNRLHGPDQETIDQIVKLSIRYGIVTEYTSFLVTETMPLGAENMERISDETYAEMMEAPAIVSGQAAVEKAVEEGDLSQAELAPTSSISKEVLKTAWSRSFIFSNGVWMDTSYDPDVMQPMQVSFLSAEYFALAESRLDVGAALALGERVLIVVDGLAYEIVTDGETDATIVLPETVATEMQGSVEIVTQESGEVELAPQQEDTHSSIDVFAETPESVGDINPQDEVVSPVRYLIFGGAAIFGLVFLLWFFTRMKK
ncbi:MAG: hypothetical protein MUO76_02675, partial [Anaerolineaceae bacterium]|nr:hypothetical protein [Anaerolineaceae bacterium]